MQETRRQHPPPGTDTGTAVLYALAALQFPLFVNTGAGAGRGHVDFTPASVEYCLTLDISIPTSESYLHIYFPLNNVKNSIT